jgi:hypothetical protein
MPVPQTVTSLAFRVRWSSLPLPYLTLGKLLQIEDQQTGVQGTQMFFAYLTFGISPVFPFQAGSVLQSWLLYSEWSCQPFAPVPPPHPPRVPGRTGLSHEHLYGLLLPPPAYRHKTLLSCCQFSYFLFLFISHSGTGYLKQLLPILQTLLGIGTYCGV